MAASAAAAIGSSFSSSMHTLKCMRSSNNYKQFLVSDNGNNGSNGSNVLLRLSQSRMLLQHSYSIEHLSLGAVTQKRRFLKLSAAVEQEEAAAIAAEQEESVETAEEEGAKEVGGDGEAVAADETEGEAPPAAEAVNTKLYFGNLPYNVDSAQLAGIIQDYGSPELIEVLYDRETGRSRGFAFVTMSTIEDCNTVIENLDGREYFGRSLRVNFSDKPRPREPLYAETDYKLFVGNLSWSVTTESLSKAFQQCGNVVGARVLYDGETGRSRGYGFVCYSTKEEMDKALESLNGVELEGRSMRVSLAQGRRS